jgi:pantothenate kinase-related protein Tda10
MPEVLDDKSDHCIPFILDRLKAKYSAGQLSPLLVGVNGAQGSGKSNLVCGTAHSELWLPFPVASASSTADYSLFLEQR